jgi:hypothetical protein
VVAYQYDPNGNGRNSFARHEVSCQPVKDVNGNYLQSPQNDRCRATDGDNAASPALTRQQPKDLKQPFQSVLALDGKPAGDKCEQNQQCANGMCGIQNNDSDLTCCKDDQSTMGFAHALHPKRSHRRLL